MAQSNNDFREFALNALRPALMMIVKWIEKKYIPAPPGFTPVPPTYHINMQPAPTPALPAEDRH